MEEYRKSYDLRDLWRLMVKRLWILVLAAATAMAGLGEYRALTYEPMYSATATLYILRQNDGQNPQEAVADDFSLALKVVNDCTYLLKSHTVLDQVIRELELDLSYEELYDRVSTSNPDNSRVLEVRVQAETPELAKQTVDRICQLGKACIARAMGFEQVSLFEYGVADQSPSNRLHGGVYALVGLSAAVIGYLILLILEFGDDRVRSREDIEDRLGMKVLGEIPDRRKVSAPKSGDDAKRMWVNLQDPAIREGICTLRANLRFHGENVGVIAVISTAEQEGKTTVAMNLAASLAELGKRVLFLDGDLRRSGAMNRYTAEIPGGLGQVLSGKKAPEECITEGEIPKLHLLLAGERSENPVELLSSEVFTDLIARCRSEYDYVIVDTPPVGCVIDGAVISAYCDGAVMVVGDGKASFRQIRDAVKQMEESGCRIMGTVRNFCPERANSYYGSL